MANSLFMVESPPLLDPHSEAKIVTCTLRESSALQSRDWGSHKEDAIAKHQSCHTPLIKSKHRELLIQYRSKVS